MTDAEIQALLDEGVAILKGTTVGYAGHSTAWQNNTSTKWWQGLDKIAQARKGLELPAAPSGIASPREPITRIVDPPTLGLNLYGPADGITKYSDYEITRSGETAVMVQPGRPGTTLRRLKLVDVAAGWHSGLNKPHALYGKAQDLVVEDLWVSTSANVTGEALSSRMPGAVIRRAHIEGHHAHVIAYFEELINGVVVPGTVLWEEVDGNFNVQTAIWIDVNSAPYCAQAFTIRRHHYTGPDPFFVRANPLTFRGHVRLEGCTLNGKPVTLAMTNLPADKLTIA